MSGRQTLGSSAAAAAVDLSASCAHELATYGRWGSAANINMLSQVPILQHVAVQMHLKSDGRNLQLGSDAQFRVSKSLDYLYEAYLGLSLPQVRLRYDPEMNVLASLSFVRNWMVYLLQRTKLYFQDLLFCEADTFAAVIHNHAMVKPEHRAARDVLMGNTAEFLTPGRFNVSTGLFDSVGATHTCYVALPILANHSGHHARGIVTGAAVFNDIRMEIELNDLSDVLQISNGQCGTRDFNGNDNGRAATYADVETCDGGCPQIRDSHIIAHGAVATAEEKKNLARMVAKIPVATYSNTNYDAANAHGTSSVTIRLSQAVKALYAGVFNVTHTRVPRVFSTFEGSSVSPWATQSLFYESTVRHTTSPQLSLLAGVGFSETLHDQHPFIGLIPFSFNIGLDRITSSVQMSRISDLVLYVEASPEMQAAAEGFDHLGSAIPVAAGQTACVNGVQDLTVAGQKQRFSVGVIALQYSSISYNKSAISLII